MEPVAASRRLAIWDWPVRLTHWGFVLLLPAMWWTAEERHMDRHQQLGMIFLALLAFRILWGFAGSATARFSQFVKGPTAVWSYLRGGAAAGGSAPGHNPLGAWSVAALLLIMTVQIALGLVAQDVDGLFSGPLNHLVSYETGDAAREWHHQTFDILLVLVAIHIAAIAYYLVVRKDNLVGPMLSGRKVVEGDVAQPAVGTRTAAILCSTAALGLAAWVWFGAPPLGD